MKIRLGGGTESIREMIIVQISLLQNVHWSQMVIVQVNEHFVITKSEQ